MEGRTEFVVVEFDKILKQTPKAFLVEVEGDEYWVAKSQVDNTGDLENDLDQPEHRREETAIHVPRWLAEENGWVE